MRRRHLLLSLAASGVVAHASARPAPLPQPALLVISKTDHVVEVRDPATFELAGRIPVGPDPHEIAVSPDGRTAYVSNPGYGAFHRIDVLDLLAGEARTPLDTAPLMGPHGLAIEHGHLWFTAQGSKAIGRFDLAHGKLDWAQGTGQDTTHMLQVSPDGRQVCATNAGSGSVSIFEQRLVPPAMPPTGVLPAGATARLDWVHTVVGTGPGTEGFDIDPGGRQLWTVAPDGKLYVIDIPARRVVATVDTRLQGAHRLAFLPGGDRVMVVSMKTGALAIVEVATRRMVHQMQTGRGAGIYIDAAGQRAFVSCTPDNFVAVVDLVQLREAGRIEVARPDGVMLTRPC